MADGGVLILSDINFAPGAARCNTCGVSVADDGMSYLDIGFAPLSQSHYCEFCAEAMFATGRAVRHQDAKARV